MGRKLAAAAQVKVQLAALYLAGPGSSLPRVGDEGPTAWQHRPGPERRGRLR